MRLLQNTLIGAMVGLFSGYVIEMGVHTTKTFAFIWAAPILLFIPLYISYYKGPLYASDFFEQRLFRFFFIGMCYPYNVNSYACSFRVGASFKFYIIQRDYYVVYL